MERRLCQVVLSVPANVIVQKSAVRNPRSLGLPQNGIMRHFKQVTWMKARWQTMRHGADPTRDRPRHQLRKTAGAFTFPHAKARVAVLMERRLCQVVLSVPANVIVQKSAVKNPSGIMRHFNQMRVPTKRSPWMQRNRNRNRREA